MAPEQALGKPVDKRADVWAFGALLYEMLAGQSPFRGATTHETVAAILHRDPDWNGVPEHLQPLVRRCLERDPRRRLRSVGDFRFLVDQTAATTHPAVRRQGISRLTVATAAVALVAIGAAAWDGSFRARLLRLKSSA
jgi:serine/threonine-protein kinase